MNRRRNLLLLLAGLVAVIGIGVFAAGRNGGTAISAKVTTVAYSDFTTRLPETGTVQRPTLRTLTAQSPGTVERVLVSPGQHVAAGQLLVELSNSQLLASAEAALQASRAASARAGQSSAVTPANNRSSVVQAEFNLEQARFNLNQALTDERNGAQSGLGYGANTAEDQRINANANLANARTTLREAKRMYDADRDLYGNKAISRDTLNQAEAKLEQAQIASNQAERQRDDVFAQLKQNVPVLRDRVNATRDQVRQAEAALEAARLQAANSSSGDIEAAQADAAARLSDYKRAQEQVDNLKLRAPYAGVIESIASQQADSLRPLQPGDPLSANQAILTLATDRGFVVRTRVDEQDIEQVRVGQIVKVSGEDLGTKTLTGRVVGVGAVAQKSDDPSNTSRQVVTTIALDRSLPFLRDGMTVDVDILTTNRPHVIAIPNDAIAKDDKNKPYVFVLRDGLAVKVPIVTGTANEAQTIVRSGLRAGDKIVIQSLPGLVAGGRVEAAPSSSPEPSSAPS